MPKTPLQCQREKKRSQQSANLDLDHLEGLLPTTALQLSPKIITWAMQHVLGLYSLLEVVPSV